MSAKDKSLIDAANAFLSAYGGDVPRWLDAEHKALAAAIDAYTEDEPTRTRYRDQARAEWVREGAIEIDDDAQVSVSSDGGAYVQGWLWVADVPKPKPTCCDYPVAIVPKGSADLCCAHCGAEWPRDDDQG
jgi:hypothetical protein